VILLVLGLGSLSALAQGPKSVPIDRKPYAIRAHFSFDPVTRVDAARRSAILDEWLGLTRRFVGEPWAIEVTDGPDRLSAFPIEALKADALKGLA
jgi:hypothetical protein